MRTWKISIAEVARTVESGLHDAGFTQWEPCVSEEDTEYGFAVRSNVPLTECDGVGIIEVEHRPLTAEGLSAVRTYHAVLRRRLDAATFSIRFIWKGYPTSWPVLEISATYRVGTGQ